MIIYGAILSPFVRKVLMFANEKGIAVEQRRGGMGQGGEEFAQASAFNKMPALRDPGAGFHGDYVLADSTAICVYMDAKHPENPLIPAEARCRGETIWLDEFADTILFGAGRDMFFNRVVSPFALKQPGDEAAALRAETEALPRVLDWLDERLDGRTYLVGEDLTFADISVVSPLFNIRKAGGDQAIAERANVARFMAEMEARPSLADHIAKAEAMLAKMTAPAG